MKRQYVRIPSVAAGKRPRPDLLTGPYDDDPVLLPTDGEVTPFIKIFPSQELKWYDTYIDSANIASNVVGSSDWFQFPASGTMSTPTRGDGDNQRQGRQILLKNWRVTGYITKPNDGVTLEPSFPINVFVAVILDTQCNGEIATDSDVFLGAALERCFPPFRNMAWSNRFQVLKSGCFKLTPASMTIDAAAVPAEWSWAGDTATFDWFCPADFLITFNNNEAAHYGSVVDNILYLVAVQSGGQQCTISLKSRIRFYDVLPQ